MTDTEFLYVVNVLKAVYPQNNFIADDTAMDVWFAMLSDLDYKAVQQAVKKHIMSEQFPPTVASIRKAVSEIENPNELNEMQAWALVSMALRDSAYHSAERYEALPENVKRAVGSHETLRAWALSDNFNENVAQSHFIATYRTILQRSNKEMVLPPSMWIETAQNNVGGYLNG